MFRCDTRRNCTRTTRRGCCWASLPQLIHLSLPSPDGYASHFAASHWFPAGPQNTPYSDPLITGVSFSEHDGIAELDVTGTAPLMANFADGRQDHHHHRRSRSATANPTSANTTACSSRANCGATAAAARCPTLPGTDRSSTRRQRHRSGHQPISSGERCCADAGAAGTA